MKKYNVNHSGRTWETFSGEDPSEGDSWGSWWGGLIRNWMVVGRIGEV